jgi:hypothetical protein
MRPSIGAGRVGGIIFGPLIVRHRHFGGFGLRYHSTVARDGLSFWPAQGMLRRGGRSSSSAWNSPLRTLSTSGLGTQRSRDRQIRSQKAVNALIHDSIGVGLCNVIVRLPTVSGPYLPDYGQAFPHVFYGRVATNRELTGLVNPGAFIGTDRGAPARPAGLNSFPSDCSFYFKNPSCSAEGIRHESNNQSD